MEENFRCNVLIMGKTGTGKSTLLNYICDANLAETGSGKPVTGEGIYEHTAVINGQEVQIYDSWGIEAGKVDRWKKLLDDSLKSHGVDKNIEDWFHSVIYCVQAGGGRVEDIDAEIIRKFLSEGYLLTVVLTKADQVDEDDEKKLKSVILGELKGLLASKSKGAFNVIATCAEKKKTRAGETQPFGKEEVQKAILDGWKDTIIERLPKHVVAKLCEYVDDWENQQINTLAGEKISGVAEDNTAIYDEIDHSAEQLRNRISKVLLKKIFEDAVASCKKADTSLRSTFNIDINALNNGRTKETCTSLKWWEYLYVIPIGSLFAIPVLISESIREKSTKHIAKEQRNIEAYIHAVSEHIKKQCEKLEGTIAKELKRSL